MASTDLLKNFKPQFAESIDTREVRPTEADANTFAASGTTKYNGQSLKYPDASGKWREALVQADGTKEEMAFKSDISQPTDTYRFVTPQKTYATLALMQADMAPKADDNATFQKGWMANIITSPAGGANDQEFYYWEATGVAATNWKYGGKSGATQDLTPYAKHGYPEGETQKTVKDVDLIKQFPVNIFTAPEKWGTYTPDENYLFTVPDNVSTGAFAVSKTLIPYTGGYIYWGFMFYGNNLSWTARTNFQFLKEDGTYISQQRIESVGISENGYGAGKILLVSPSDVPSEAARLLVSMEIIGTNENIKGVKFGRPVLIITTDDYFVDTYLRTNSLFIPNFPKQATISNSLGEINSKEALSIKNIKPKGFPDTLTLFSDFGSTHGSVPERITTFALESERLHIIKAATNYPVISYNKIKILQKNKKFKRVVFSIKIKCVSDVTEILTNCNFTPNLRINFADNSFIEGANIIPLPYVAINPSTNKEYVLSTVANNISLKDIDSITYAIGTPGLPANYVSKADVGIYIYDPVCVGFLEEDEDLYRSRALLKSFYYTNENKPLSIISFSDNSPLQSLYHGRKFNFWGDSITATLYYPTLITRYLSAYFDYDETINGKDGGHASAVGGMRLRPYYHVDTPDIPYGYWWSIYQRVTEATIYKPEIGIIFIGVNDYNAMRDEAGGSGDKPLNIDMGLFRTIVGNSTDAEYLGEPIDTRTSSEKHSFASFYKGMLIKAMQASPSTKWVTVTLPQQSALRDSTPTYSKEELDALTEQKGLMCNAIREISQQLGIQCADVWRNSGINRYTTSIMYGDTVHPSGAGHFEIMRCILKELI